MPGVWDKLCGKHNEVFLTAEIGINHEGSYDLAARMVEAAAATGAHAVKFQVFKTSFFYNPVAAHAATELFRGLELTHEEFARLSELSRKLGIIFYGTPLDFESADFLAGLGCLLFKVASSDITNEPFLRHIAALAERHSMVVLLSSGLVTMEELDRAVKIFRKTRFGIEYCVSKYPAHARDIDLLVMDTYRKRYNCPVGFSDHTLGNTMSIAAAAMGARMIERHFTLDSKRKGLDHSLSLDPVKMKELAEALGDVCTARKTGKKELTDFEKKIREPSMRGIYAARDIEAGSIIKADDILLLRPGNGVRMDTYAKLAGSKAKKHWKQYEKLDS